MKLSPFLFAALVGIDATPSVVEVKLPRSSGFACSRLPAVDVLLPTDHNPSPIKRSKRSAAAEKRRARKRHVKKRRA